jgi:hypothetical protein
VDNIQKSIFAVLGFAAFIALIIPNGDKIAPPAQQATPQIQPSEMIQPAPEQPVDESDTPSDEFASQDGELEAPDDLAAFGQPMIDASAPGEANNQSEQTNLPAGALSNQPVPMDAAPGGQYVTGPTNAPLITNHPIQ